MDRMLFIRSQNERGSLNIDNIILKVFRGKGRIWPGQRDPASDRSKGPREIKPAIPSKRFYFYLLLGIAAFLMVTFSNLTGLRDQLFVKEVSNVHYIDSVGPNFLFRGGLPQIGRPSAFNYPGLKRAIINAGEKAGVKVPSSFYLIDVNLLNIENPVDARRIMVEQKFFQTNPKLGLIQVWGMNGTGLSVNDPALTVNRDYLASNLEGWLNDRLPSRVEQLRKWLEGAKPVLHIKTSLPMVIYIHCVAGCDRTGEFSGAYYLRYMNKSWEEVNALNRSMCHRNRPFGCKNYRALQWYCLWLNLERGFYLNWWKEFPCSGK